MYKLADITTTFKIKREMGTVTPTPEPGETAAPSAKPSPQLGTATNSPDESGQTGNQIEKRKDLSIFLVTGKQKDKNSMRLTWQKYNGASGYEIYWSYCDGERSFKKAGTVKASGKRMFIHKRCKKDRAYKYYIAAYKMREGKKKYIAKSPIIHVAMKYEKQTNVKKISLSKAKVTLKGKKSFQIKAEILLWDKKKKPLSHAPALRYYSGNRNVAVVNTKGMITAKGKGRCTVYVISNNGLTKKIKVNVK